MTNYLNFNSISLPISVDDHTSKRKFSHQEGALINICLSSLCLDNKLVGVNEVCMNFFVSFYKVQEVEQ